MQILISPPKSLDPAYAVHVELQKAFQILNAALIPLIGGEVVNGDPMFGVIRLKFAADLSRSLRLLDQGGIQSGSWTTSVQRGHLSVVVRRVSRVI